MYPSSWPRFCCPACGAVASNLPRKAGTADHLLIIFADIPFWIVVGLCIALGMVDWVAGLVGFAALPFLYYLWDRSRSHFECTRCARRFDFYEAVVRVPHGA